MRLLFTILIMSTILFGETQMGLKGGGCTLAQKGPVTIFYNANIYTNVSYKANAKSGKNFREIFIGSLFDVNKDLKLTIVDYLPNKRIKGKPKTGIFIVEVKLNNKLLNIQMAYIFDNGIISATGVINKTTIVFYTKVNYSLCFTNRT